MLVNFVTEDGTTVNEAVELDFLPSEGFELELADATVYTVEKLRYTLTDGQVWALVASGKSGKDKTKDKTKKPHPFKDR